MGKGKYFRLCKYGFYKGCVRYCITALVFVVIFSYAWHFSVKFTDKLQSSSGGSMICNPLEMAGQVVRATYAYYGVHGVPKPPRAGCDGWLRIVVPRGEFYGVGFKVPLCGIGLEGWVSWDFRIVGWEHSKYSMKLPGVSANYTSNAIDVGGNGGAGGGGSRSWSARMTITPYVSSKQSKAELGYELYHSGGKKNGYGEDRKWRVMGSTTKINASQVLDDTWQSVKHYVRLNSIGQYDGEIRGYLNGSLRNVSTGLNLSNNDKYRNIALYVNVYHGGKIPATSDFEYHISNIRYYNSNGDDAVHCFLDK